MPGVPSFLIGLFQSILFVDKLLPALRLTNSSSPPLASRKPALNADIFTDLVEVAFPRPQPATSMHRLPVAMQSVLQALPHSIGRLRVE